MNGFDWKRPLNGGMKGKKMNDCQDFPETVEEFMEEYKMVDTEEVYSNGTEYVSIFRMKQWFEHERNTAYPKKGKWIPVTAGLPEKDGDYLVTSVHYGWNDQKYISIEVEAYYTRNGTEEYGTCLAYKGWQGGEKVIAWMPLPEPYRGE